MPTKSEEDRMAGCFYGCAVGDALGLPLEFEERDARPTVKDMYPSLHYGVPPGTWSDDTSMMLCLAASMAANNGSVDPYSELSHYVAWLRKGYLTPDGVTFDVGTATKRAIARFEKTHDVLANTTREMEQGNGSLMRIAPVPIMCWNDLPKALHYGYQSSTTTHAHPTCATLCGVYAALCAAAIQGQSKAQLLHTLATCTSQVHPKLHAMLHGAFLQKSRTEIKSTGFVVDTFEAALWAFFTTDSFEDGAICAVNLGNDADTVGAVYGTLAGAHYGYDAIPKRWLNALRGRQLLDGVFADVLACVRQQ